jgi:DNA invertase Pin-like site-specific DNA recombinase
LLGRRPAPRHLQETKEKLAAAARRGRKGGRPTKMTPDRLAQARRMRAEEISYRRIGKALGISEITVRRAMAAGYQSAAIVF